MRNEIDHMQVRLFRLAWKKWNITLQRCAEIFDEYDIDGLIEDMYEIFHVQGDNADLEEIEEYLKTKGVAV